MRRKLKDLSQDVVAQDEILDTIRVLKHAKAEQLADVLPRGKHAIRFLGTAATCAATSAITAADGTAFCHTVVDQHVEDHVRSFGATATAAVQGRRRCDHCIWCGRYNGNSVRVVVR